MITAKQFEIAVQDMSNQELEELQKILTVKKLNSVRPVTRKDYWATEGPTMIGLMKGRLVAAAKQCYSLEELENRLGKFHEINNG